jgi:hypothetical protein
VKEILLQEKREAFAFGDNLKKFNFVTHFKVKMSINVIERNGSDCKYVEIFTHRVGSIGASSRRTVFVSGTNTKQ